MSQDELAEEKKLEFYFETGLLRGNNDLNKGHRLHLPKTTK